MGTCYGREVPEKTVFTFNTFLLWQAYHHTLADLEILEVHLKNLQHFLLGIACSLNLINS